MIREILIIVVLALLAASIYLAVRRPRPSEPKMVRIRAIDNDNRSDGVKSFMALTVPLKMTYGVMYGLISWDEEGASMLYDFLNNQIWRQGYKVEHFDVEHAQIGGSHVAFVMGIVRPKTIIDRILY